MMVVAGALLVSLAALAVGARAQPEQRAPTTAEASPAPEQDELFEKLEDVRTRLESVRDLRAKFEQRKHTPLLKKPLVSGGSLIVKGETARWDTRTPRPSVMVIGGGSIRIYYPEAGVVEEYEAGEDGRELAGAALPKLGVLREHFELCALEPASLGAPSAEGFLALGLTPRSEEMKRHLSQVRVLLDTRVPCVKRVEFTDTEGERTEIIFEDVRVNTGVEAGELELRVPEGTRTSRPGSGRAASPPAEPAR